MEKALYECVWTIDAATTVYKNRLITLSQLSQLILTHPDLKVKKCQRGEVREYYLEPYTDDEFERRLDNFNF